MLLYHKELFFTTRWANIINIIATNDLMIFVAKARGLLELGSSVRVSIEAFMKGYWFPTAKISLTLLYLGL